MGNPDPAFNRVPEHHQERFDGLRTYWEKEAQKREDEKRAGLEKAEPDLDEQKQQVLTNVLQELEKSQPVAGVSQDSTSSTE